MSRSPSSPRLSAVSRYCGSSAVTRAPYVAWAGMPSIVHTGDHRSEDQQRPPHASDIRITPVVDAAQHEQPGQRARGEHEHDRGRSGFGEEPALERAPDASGERLETDGGKQERGRQFLDRGEQNETATSHEPGSHQRKLDRARAAHRRGAEQSCGLADMLRHGCDCDLGRTHCLRAEVDHVGRDQQWCCLIEAVEERHVECPEREAERDHQTWHSEASDDRARHRRRQPAAIPGSEQRRRQHQQHGRRRRRSRRAMSSTTRASRRSAS